MRHITRLTEAQAVETRNALCSLMNDIKFQFETE